MNKNNYDMELATIQNNCQELETFLIYQNL